ncbi:sterol desaturase family protein [Phenylobacterium sp.]|uniref:sterol desaturase family protein n=1 Tax=Phenylobacterium sp. TaxID=1871053 RepID=UPI002FE35DBA
MFGFYDYLLFGLFAAFAALDVLAPARAFPAVRGWRMKGVVSAVLYWLIATRAPFLWDGFLGQHTLIDARALPLWAQAPLAFLAYELGVYAWHRTMHGSDLLWRTFHQTHHSAERVDIWGSLYFHPLDMLGWAFLGSFTLVFAFGFAPEAVLFAFSAATFCGLFQHANLKTPQWLGWFVARPEMHSLHHERGVHRFNYGDIPLWDMVFGTWRNPKTWAGEAGFYDGASQRLGDLLIGRDVAGGEQGCLRPAPEGAR